jgi:hypothetical protein
MTIESTPGTESALPGPDEGGGPPPGLPWTLVVETEGWYADLEHGAALPRAGERIEYIAEDGERRLYRVRDVVHTVQRASSQRPRVADEQTGPNTLVQDEGAGRVPTSLRAGLPRVFVDPEL